MIDKNELIPWSGKFACGIALIDNQHKELVMLVNDMFNHITGDVNQENEYFKQVINKAINYIKVHFATEEKIMLATNFEGYAEHKRKHDTFVLAVVKNVRDYKDGKRLTLLTFTKFLKDWILTHIALMDKQYFDYLRSIATRKANGKLSITVSEMKKLNNNAQIRLSA